MRAALYLRVSTVDQDLEHQRRELVAEVARRGWELADTYAEKVSGVSSRRPELERMMHDAAMSRFRVVFVWSVDRLGRSMLEVLNVVEELRKHGVAFVSLRQPALDSSGATGKIVLAVMAGVAELERELIRQRTRAGLATARARGKRLGRPTALKTVTPEQVRHLLSLNSGAVARTARQLGVSVSTVQRAARAATASKTGST